MLDRFDARRELRRGASWALRRLQPHASTTAWNTALSVRSALGAGPLLAPPLASRALILAPHPDDETIGCGGTVAALAKTGAQVDVTVVTSGETSVSVGGGANATAAQRRTETELACERLGLRPPQFLDLPDGHLGAHLDGVRAGIGDALTRAEPEVVFAPWPGDGHPDHEAVASALTATGIGCAREVWWYEVWAPLHANRVVDITDVWSTKTAALACHRTAGDLSAHAALARWRSLFGLDGSGYAEAFIVSGPSELPTIREGT